MKRKVRRNLPYGVGATMHEASSIRASKPRAVSTSRVGLLSIALEALFGGGDYTAASVDDFARVRFREDLFSAPS